MKKEVIVRLHASFEELVQKDEDGGEFWLARDLQALLGYAKRENFAKVIERASTAWRVSGYDPADHFLDVRKMVDLCRSWPTCIEIAKFLYTSWPTCIAHRHFPCTPARPVA